MDLFNKQNPEASGARPPLAARMRPQTLAEIAGQDHMLGPGKLLRRAIESDRLASLILYGPPGCGKTSLAEVIARVTRRHFEKTSGVLANVAVLRDLLQAAFERRRREGVQTILFLDEIHHFNKSQQDILLPYVEDGAIILIGATTHNPFFFVNSPLTSRSQIFELEPLTEEVIIALLRRALTDERGLGPSTHSTGSGQADSTGSPQAGSPLRDSPGRSASAKPGAATPGQAPQAGPGSTVEADDDALAHLARVCEGDARRALNALEIAALTTPPNVQGRIHITRAITEDSIQKKAVVYDRDDDGHYDTISAFIKSVRGSDPHAAVYWLAKMIYAGEDPRFIARRLIILASEDIGNADPRGLLMAVAGLHAVEFVGLPEARIILSHVTTYLACAPKSNAAYLAVEKALGDIKEGRVLPVPKPLRGSSYQGAKRLGHTGYQYAHEYKDHFVDQAYLPTSAVYYEPTSQGYEDTLKQRLAQWDQMRQKAGRQTPDDRRQTGEEEKSNFERRTPNAGGERTAEGSASNAECRSQKSKIRNRKSEILP